MVSRMKFTFDSYKNLISKILQKGYTLTNYSDYQKHEMPCILRHDVDMDLQMAEKFAKFETDNNIKSTYYILLSSELYTVCSKRSTESISNILGGGHSIGLHFDEVKYDRQLEKCESIEEKIEMIKKYINNEVQILSMLIGHEVSTVSMHRPSRFVLEADIQMPCIINSYSKRFFEDFKYISDSKMHWREDVEQIVEGREYKALHILTHPFWYYKENKNIDLCMNEWFSMKSDSIYDTMKEVLL